MIEKTPEDEAFEEIERKQKSPLIHHPRVQSVEEAFEHWGAGKNAHDYQVKRDAFFAGWAAGVRNELRKESND